MSNAAINEQMRRMNEVPKTVNLPLPGQVEGPSIPCVHSVSMSLGLFQPMKGSIYGTFKGDNGSQFTVAKSEVELYL